MIGVFRRCRRRLECAPQHEYLRKGREPTHHWNQDSNRNTTTMVSNPHACTGIDEKWEVRSYVASGFLAIATAACCYSHVFYGIVHNKPIGPAALPPKDRQTVSFLVNFLCNVCTFVDVRI